MLQKVLAVIRDCNDVDIGLQDSGQCAQYGGLVIGNDNGAARGCGAGLCHYGEYTSLLLASQVLFPQSLAFLSLVLKSYEMEPSKASAGWTTSRAGRKFLRRSRHDAPGQKGCNRRWVHHFLPLL